MHRKSRKPRRLPTEAGNVPNKKEEKKEAHNPWKTRSEIRYARHLEYIRNLTRQGLIHSREPGSLICDSWFQTKLKRMRFL